MGGGGVCLSAYATEVLGGVQCAQYWPHPRRPEFDCQAQQAGTLAASSLDRVLFQSVLDLASGCDSVPLRQEVSPTGWFGKEVELREDLTLAQERVRCFSEELVGSASYTLRS